MQVHVQHSAAIDGRGSCVFGLGVDVLASCAQLIVFVNLCTHILTCTHTHMYAHSHVHMYAYSHVCILMYTYSHVHILTCTHTHMYAYSHVHIHRISL